MTGRAAALTGLAAFILLAMILQPLMVSGDELGDANCDGSGDSVDAALVLQFDAGLLTSLACEAAADVDGNNTINSVDAALVLQTIAGLSEPIKVIVTIDGTPGVRFSGVAGTRDQVESGSVRDIVGTTPMTFAVDARASIYGPTGYLYSVVVGKVDDDSGLLRVTLQCPDGLHSDEGSQPYVSLVASCAGR